MSGLLTYAVGSALVLLWDGFRLFFYRLKTIRINRFLLNIILCFSVFMPVFMSYVSIPVSGRTRDVVGLMAKGDSMMSDLKLVKMIPSVGSPDKFDCSMFYGAVEEALPVPLRWTPGRVGVKPVSVSHIFPVTFQIKG